MKRTGPSEVDVFPCVSAAVPAARSGLGLVLLVRHGDVVAVEAVDDRVRVDARQRAERVPDQLVVVQQQRRREVRELERSEDTPLAPRSKEARGDHGTASTTGARETLLRRQPERHPVAAPERHVPEDRPSWVVPALDEAARILAQADHHDTPVELVAVAPLEYAERWVRRVGPGACGVGVEGRPDHGRTSIVVMARRGNVEQVGTSPSPGRARSRAVYADRRLHPLRRGVWEWFRLNVGPCDGPRRRRQRARRWPPRRTCSTRVRSGGGALERRSSRPRDIRYDSTGPTRGQRATHPNHRSPQASPCSRSWRISSLDPPLWGRGLAARGAWQLGARRPRAARRSDRAHHLPPSRSRASVGQKRSRSTAAIELATRAVAVWRSCDRDPGPARALANGSASPPTVRVPAVVVGGGVPPQPRAAG